MRQLTGFWDRVVKALSVALILFQLYTTGVRPFSDIIQRSVHLAFVLTLVFLMKPMRKGRDLDRVPWYDVAFALLAAASSLYVTYIYDTIVYKPLIWVSAVDKVFAVVLVILILEASRRSVGWTFPILGTAFLVYAYWGELFPGIWRHQNFSFNKIFQTLYHNGTGIWGTMLGLSAGMLAMFSIFSAILAGTGGAETFIKMGQRITGQATGGSGKIAVVASSLFGMISGSAMGNVVATGVFTIPSMKRAGYTGEWAATIESVASTGGQILPPIMGAAAFIMAQLIGTSYLSIAKAAIIPAVLFYISCFVSIHLVSCRDGIRGEKSRPEVKITEYVVILVPLAVFLFYLLRGYTVNMGAFWATLLALLTYLACFGVNTRELGATLRSTGSICFTTCVKGAGSIVEMCGILAGSQITIALISLTGFATKLSSIIVALGENSVFLCLLCSMLVCIILGMGLPTTASYIICATAIAPALIKIGLPALAAHLFLLYFACISAITPPVAVASYAAAGIAEENPMKVGFTAVKLGIAGFVLPFVFALNTDYLHVGLDVLTLFTWISAFVVCYAAAVAIQGYVEQKITVVERLLYLVVVFTAIQHNFALSIFGWVLFAGLYGFRLMQHKKAGAAAA